MGAGTVSLCPDSWEGETPDMTHEDWMREYLQRDAEYRAAGGIGHLIWGGADDDEKPDGDGETPEPDEEAEADDDGDDLPEPVRETLRAQRLAEREARREAARLARERDELQQRLAAIEESEKDEMTRAAEARERAEQRATAAEAALRETALRYEVTLQAGRMGLRDPEVAVRLLDQREIEYGESGAPTNIGSLLEELVKTYPYLKRPTREEGTGDVPSPDDRAMTDEEIRKKAGARLPRVML